MSVFHRTVFLTLLFAVTADGRVWTNTHGRTFEAEYVGTNGTKVVFRLPHGKQFEMPLLDLSPGDQALVRSSAKAPIEDLRSNFGRPWPRSVTPKGNPGCKVISENREKNHHIYESPGYRFHCDARITEDALSGFATVFEATRAYLAALPISLMSGETLGTRSRVLLFGEKEAYLTPT